MWMWTQYTRSDWMSEKKTDTKNHNDIEYFIVQSIEFLLSVVEHADVRTGWNDSLIKATFYCYLYE